MDLLKELRLIGEKIMNHSIKKKIYEKMREETSKLQPVLTQQSKENNGYSKHNLYKYRPGRKYAK